MKDSITLTDTDNVKIERKICEEVKNIFMYIYFKFERINLAFELFISCLDIRIIS